MVWPVVGARSAHAVSHVVFKPVKEPRLCVVVKPEKPACLFQMIGPRLTAEPQHGFADHLAPVAFGRRILDASPGDWIGIGDQAEPFQKPIILTPCAGRERAAGHLGLDTTDDTQVDVWHDLPAAQDRSTA